MRSLRHQKEAHLPTLQDLKDQLIDRRLQGLSDPLSAVIEHAAQPTLALLTPLSRLADSALAQRFHHAIALRGRQATLADQLTIDPFDCSHHQSRPEQKTRLLHRLHRDCARAPMAVRRIGNPGAGKTCLATCLASAACNANIQVLLTTAIAMIHHRIAAEADRALLKKLQDSQAPERLVLDALGYWSLGQQGSHLFFQVMSGRQQLPSTVMTTTLPCADWGTVFDSTTGATALADRLVDNSAVLILGGSRSRRKLTEAYRGRPTSTGEPNGPNHHP